MPDSLSPIETRVQMDQADTWVVTYWRRCPILRRVVWSTEAFIDQSEACDFYGDIEAGERCVGSQVGSIIAFKDGQPIGPLPLRKVAAIIREADTGGYHP